MSTSLPWLVLLPLLGAAISLLIRQKGVLFLFIIGFIHASLLQALFILYRDILDRGPLLNYAGGWVPPLGISLHADGTGFVFLFMTNVIFTICGFYAHVYFTNLKSEAAASRTPAGPRANADSHANTDSHVNTFFWPLWFFLWAAINGILLAADVFNVYVLLELMSISSVALVSLSDEHSALNAGLRYLLASLLGSLTYLLGVGILYAHYGTLDLHLLSGLIINHWPAWVSLSLMSGGLILKTALFPLHFWLPQAHASAHAPVSAVLSALVIKATLFTILRLWFGGAFQAVDLALAGSVVGALGAIAIIWGSLQALQQSKLKLIIAYSTVAQIGYFFLIFPILCRGFSPEAWFGGIYMMLSHGFAKAAMFLAAGTAIHCLGTDNISRFCGLARISPGTTLAFTLSGVSLIGLPPSGGFVGKWYLLTAVIKTDQWILVPFILIGSLLAAAYVFRVLWYAFLEPKDRATDPTRPPNPGTLECPSPRFSYRMTLGALILALASILLGLRAADVFKILQAGSPFPISTGGD